MKDEDLFSGFIDTDSPAGMDWQGRQESEGTFQQLQLMYESVAGPCRLFRCSRYGRVHVLKTLRPEYRHQEFYEQALYKEFSIGYQLEHPYIVRTLGWEEVEGLGPCILMEYIDGLSLKEWMRQGHITRPLALKVLSELCSALQYLHSKQIIHRDLKPDNILLTYNGTNVKLLDFSLSDTDDYEILKQPAGTRHYMAPEAFQSENSLDCRADLYSMGLIIGEIATLLNDRHWAAVSRRCTKMQREKRYASAEEVLEALRTPASFKYKTRLLGVAAAVAALLAGGYLLWSADPFSVSRPQPVVGQAAAYGNQTLNEPCRRLWAAEQLRLRHAAARWTHPQAWQEDSLLTVRRMQQVYEQACPVSEWRQTPAFLQQQKLFLREVDRRLHELHRSLSRR